MYQTKKNILIYFCAVLVFTEVKILTSLLIEVGQL